MASLIEQTVEPLVERIAERALAAGKTVAVAESCTGGLLAGSLTELAGSSAWFSMGLVTYSNESKQQLLNVGGDTLQLHGAVSEEVAREMAEGVLRKVVDASLLAVVSITGIAGPGGGTDLKPVGMVCFGWPSEGGRVLSKTCIFSGNRSEVRVSAVHEAQKLLLQQL